MSKAVKRGNAWNVRVYDYTDAQGKQHNRSFTAPTKAEAEYLAAEFKRNRKPAKGVVREMTVGQAIDKYIALKPSLSPTTLTSYEKMRKYAFVDIMDLPVAKLDDIAMQEAVNRESMRISERTGEPISVKTLKNEYGLLASALKVVCKRTYIVTLPTKHKHAKEYPSVPAVLSVIKGTDVELPCLLALWLSFRMSEIRGLRCSDYRNGYLHIDRVIVDTNKGAVIKDNAKTEKSLRKRKVSPYLDALIRASEPYRNYLTTGEDGFLVTMERGRIYRHWKALARSLGYDMTFHDLRHLFATTTAILGIPSRFARDFGGWEDSGIMERYYQEVLTDERAYYQDMLNDYFEKNIPKHLPHKS